MLPLLPSFTRSTHLSFSSSSPQSSSSSSSNKQQHLHQVLPSSKHFQFTTFLFLPLFLHLSTTVPTTPSLFLLSLCLHLTSFFPLDSLLPFIYLLLCVHRMIEAIIIVALHHSKYCVLLLLFIATSVVVHRSINQDQQQAEKTLPLCFSHVSIVHSNHPSLFRCFCLNHGEPLTFLGHKPLNILV